jgi:hypothetical protein
MAHNNSSSLDAWDIVEESHEFVFSRSLVVLVSWFAPLSLLNNPLLHKYFGFSSVQKTVPATSIFVRPRIISVSLFPYHLEYSYQQHLPLQSAWSQLPYYRVDYPKCTLPMAFTSDKARARYNELNDSSWSIL